MSKTNHILYHEFHLLERITAQHPVFSTQHEMAIRLNGMHLGQKPAAGILIGMLPFFAVKTGKIKGIDLVVIATVDGLQIPLETIEYGLQQCVPIHLVTHYLRQRHRIGGIADEYLLIDIDAGTENAIPHPTAQHRTF